MGDINEQIEREVAKRLAEHYAREAARDQTANARDRRWRAKLEQRELARAERQAERDHLCGAQTRTGTPCKRRGNGAGGRCPNHGGMSTGPRTKAGRQRIAAAQRRRWANTSEASA